MFFCRLSQDWVFSREINQSDLGGMDDGLFSLFMNHISSPLFLPFQESWQSLGDRGL